MSTIEGLHCMFSSPPLPQVENLLLSARGAIKLCDFGSATTERLHPDRSWTAVQRGLAEDEVRLGTRSHWVDPSLGLGARLGSRPPVTVVVPYSRKFRQGEISPNAVAKYCVKNCQIYFCTHLQKFDFI